MENLWIIKDIQKENNTTDLVNFINEQIAYLADGTAGKVQAHFIPKRLSLGETIVAFASSSPFSSSRRRDGEDASQLYEKTKYEFFISDKQSKYELAIFDLCINDVYPAKLLIDPSIASEAKLDQEISVKNLEQFQKCFQRIIQSPKVVYVIGKLMQLPDEGECFLEESSNEASCDVESDEV